MTWLADMLIQQGVFCHAIRPDELAVCATVGIVLGLLICYELGYFDDEEE